MAEKEGVEFITLHSNNVKFIPLANYCNFPVVHPPASCLQFSKNLSLVVTPLPTNYGQEEPPERRDIPILATAQKLDSVHISLVDIEIII